MSDNIIDPILQPTAKSINEDLQNNSIQLKKAAREFLSGVRKLIADYSHIRVLLKSQNTGTRTSLNKIYEDMKSNVNITQKCIQLQYDFENSLNKFLGREIYLLYITDEGKMLYANELSAAKIYQTATTKTDGKGSIKDLDITKLTQFPKEISEDFKTNIKRRQGLYAPIRDEVITRWTQNHDSNNKWVKRDENLKNTFYWLIGKTKDGKNQWDWSKQINRGHIYETYAHLVWEETNLINFDSAKESDIGAFWNYMESHGLLNSVAGIVKGDVSFFLNPSIQFAVKSGSFNTAAIGSYLDVAYQLSYGKIQIDKNMIEILLKNLASYSYNVRQHGLKIAEEKLNNFIQQAIK